MTRTTSYCLFTTLAVLPMLGCGLEEITDGDGGDDAIPPAVQTAFDESCATNNTCHANDGSQVKLGPGASEAILTTMAANGEPFVVLGDVQASYLARKMLGTDITGGQMPLSSQSPNDDVNVAIILGWIAGAEFTDGGGDGDGDTTTGDGDGDMPCFAEAPAPAMPSFATDVWPILEGRCANAGCHGNMTTVPLMPDSGGAFTNLVGVASSAGMDYVTADVPDDSYLWHKLSGTQTIAGGGGATMPFGGQMCTAEMQTIYAWILTGASP
jgi:hypothetical protein